MKAVQEFLDALVNESVMGNVVGPVFQLFAGREFAKEDQVGGLEISAALGEFLDGVSAIAQDAGIAIDEGNLAFAEGRVVEGGVVAHHAEVALIQLDLPEVKSADGIVGNRHFVGFAVAIDGNGERVPGHAIGLSDGRLRRWLDWIHVLCLSLSLQSSSSM